MVLDKVSFVSAATFSVVSLRVMASILQGLLSKALISIQSASNKIFRTIFGNEKDHETTIDMRKDRQNTH